MHHNIYKKWLDFCDGGDLDDEFVDPFNWYCLADSTMYLPEGVEWEPLC